MEMVPNEPLPVTSQKREIVLRELQRILSSKLFSRARRQAAILAYLIRTTLDGNESEISEYSIARSTCDKDIDFQPDVDPTVRVEMFRLRTRLKKFYSTEGLDSEIEIMLPAGYIPRCQPRSIFKESNVPTTECVTPDAIGLRTFASYSPEAVEASSVPRPASISRTVALWIGLGAILGVAISIFARTSSVDYQSSLLTSGNAKEPTLSPRGDQVAFTWDGNSHLNTDIYVKSVADNDLLRLTTDRSMDYSPAWSPDGHNVAFLRRLEDDRLAGIYVVPAKGGVERKVGQIRTMVSGICWTPDSRWIVVPDSPPSVPLALFLLSPTTGERRQLTDYGNFFYPSVSPDGRMLVFASHSPPTPSIFSLRFGKDWRPEGHVSRLPGTAKRDPSWPKWAKDGKSLYFSSDGGSLYRYWLRSHQVEPIRYLEDVQMALPLPDDSGLLIARGKDQDMVLRVPLSTNTQKEPQSPFSLTGSEPDVSPDGQRVAFLSARKGGTTLQISDLEGRDAKAITTVDSQITRPRWSPDSQALVFSVRKQVYWALFRAWLKTGRIEELAVNRQRDNYNPSYSRDGRWIYFLSNLSGSPEIWKIPASGGSEVLVSPAPAQDMEESVQGDALFYRFDATIFRFCQKDGSVSAALNREYLNDVFRTTPEGLLYQVNTRNGMHKVELQPISGEGPVIVYQTTEAIKGFTMLPDRKTVLVGLHEFHSNLELVRRKP